jgi:hypothetical protein
MLMKYCSLTVLSAVLVPRDASKAQLQSLGHRHDFRYEPKPGFLYVRSRAISSRTNDNYDEFPAEEIKKAYATFIGKPVFVNHNNENHRRARGVCIDAALHEDRNKDGSPDTWVEALMEIDAIRFPKLAEAIIAGHIDRTSMGTDVAYSICSACGNKASSPSEYCQHIPRQKGQRIYKNNPKTGAKEGVLIREKCFGLGFFENSLLVEEPADPTAYMWGVDTRGLNKAASKTAIEKKPEDSPHSDQEWEDAGEEFHKMWDDLGWKNMVEEEKSKARKPKVEKRQDPSHPPKQASTKDPDDGYDDDGNIPLDEDSINFFRQMRDLGETHREMSDHANTRTVDLSDPDDLKSHMYESHGWQDSDLWRNSHDQDHPEMGEGTDEDRPLSHEELRGAHHHEHTVQYPRDYESAVTMDDSHFHTAKMVSYADLHTAASKTVGAAQRTTPTHAQPCRAVPSLAPPSHALPRAINATSMVASYEDFHRTAAKRAPSKGDQFFASHPGNPQNIINTFNGASPKQHSEGMQWYKEFHKTSRMITGGRAIRGKNEVEGGNPAMGAGLLGVTSAQSLVPDNHVKAAMTFRAGRGLGGTKEDPSYHPGYFGTRENAEKAQRILNGEHHSTVMGYGSPKTSNFAHLTEHAGDDPEHVAKEAAAGRDGRRVAVDRHALSVYLGHRVTEKEYKAADLSAPPSAADKAAGFRENHRYRMIADAYRHAADALSEQHGQTIHPHEAQAVTWVARRDQTNKEEENSTDRLVRGQQTRNENANKRWINHVHEFFPEFKENMHWRLATLNKTAIGFPAIGAFMTGHDTVHPYCEHHEDAAREAAFKESPEVMRVGMFGTECPHCAESFPEPEHEPSVMEDHLVTHHGYPRDMMPGGRHYDRLFEDPSFEFPESWRNKPDTVVKQLHADDHYAYPHGGFSESGGIEHTHDKDGHTGSLDQSHQCPEFDEYGHRCLYYQGHLDKHLFTIPRNESGEEPEEFWEGENGDAAHWNPSLEPGTEGPHPDDEWWWSHHSSSLITVGDFFHLAAADDHGENYQRNLDNIQDDDDENFAILDSTDNTWHHGTCASAAWERKANDPKEYSADEYAATGGRNWSGRSLNHMTYGDRYWWPNKRTPVRCDECGERITPPTPHESWADGTFTPKSLEDADWLLSKNDIGPTKYSKVIPVEDFFRTASFDQTEDGWHFLIHPGYRKSESQCFNEKLEGHGPFSISGRCIGCGYTTNDRPHEDWVDETFTPHGADIAQQLLKMKPTGPTKYSNKTVSFEDFVHAASSRKASR